MQIVSPKIWKVYDFVSNYYDIINHTLILPFSYLTINNKVLQVAIYLMDVIILCHVGIH